MMKLKSSRPWVHLGMQSVLPNITGRRGQRIHWDLAEERSYFGSWGLRLNISRQTADEEISGMNSKYP